MTGLLAAIYDIGCSLGAVFAFMFAENLGRKRSIIYSDSVMIIGALIQAASFSYWQLFAARIVAGIGTGFATCAVPLLQSETVPARKRGALLMLQALTVGLGIAVATWVCFGTSHVSSSFDWRFPIAFSAFGPLVAVALSPGLVETPRWLCQKGRIAEARVVVSRLLDRPEDSPEVTGQMNEMLENIEKETKNGEPTWNEVFSNSTPTRNLQRALLGMAPFIMNQWYVLWYVESYLWQ